MSDVITLDESDLIAAPAKKTKRPILLLCHAEKGGAGKSFCAALGASAALDAGLSVMVIETDSTIPDVGPRFEGQPGAEAKSLPLDQGADARQSLRKLLNGIEKLMLAPSAPDFVVVNLPAGASGVVDTYAEDFAYVSDELDLDLTVAFVVDNSRAVLPTIEESMAKGILSINTARRALVYAGWKGDISKFPVASSAARAAAIESGVTELLFPELGPDELFEVIQASDQPFGTLAKRGSELPTGDRAAFCRWLAECKPLSNFLIGRANG